MQQRVCNEQRSISFRDVRMEIVKGELYENKTRRYLFPCLRVYGKEFVDRLNTDFFKQAIGISKEDPMAINILVDTTFTRMKFVDTLYWLRSKDYFIKDYPYGQLSSGDLHMVSIRLPYEYKNSYDMFLEGKYSKMYTPEQLQEVFSEKKESERISLQVLTKDSKFLPKFVETINRDFNTTLLPSEFEGELDYPLDYKEESFN